MPGIELLPMILQGHEGGIDNEHGQNQVFLDPAGLTMMCWIRQICG